MSFIRAIGLGIGIGAAAWIRHEGRQVNSWGNKIPTLIQRLRTLNRLWPCLAENDKTLTEARKALRTYHRIPKPLFDLCSEELLAAKLGINAEIFAQNPGFKEFASAAHLERYLVFYSHTLKVNHDTGKLSILKGGTYHEWASIKQEVSLLLQRAKTMKQPWLYGQEGIQEKDMCRFDTLEPYLKRDPSSWNQGYIFELCTCSEDKPDFNNMHTWIRLRTPEGDYTASIYRPAKGQPLWKTNLLFPFRTRKAIFVGVEVSEFWPCNITRIPFQITTKEQFLKMKAEIERLKALDEYPFQNNESVCIHYCKKIATAGGLDCVNELPTVSPHPAVLFLPKKLRERVELLSVKLPRVTKVINAVTTPFFNLILLLLGAGMVDKQVKKTFSYTVKPNIASVKDLFNPAKWVVHHPYTLAFKTRDYAFKHPERFPGLMTTRAA